VDRRDNHVCTAILTLVGMLIGLWLNRRSQQEERLVNRRREAYLKASEPYSVAMQIRSLLADPRIEDKVAGIVSTDGNKRSVIRKFAVGNSSDQFVILIGMKTMTTENHETVFALVVLVAVVVTALIILAVYL